MPSRVLGLAALLSISSISTMGACDSKTDAKSETKPETKAETKPETKSETKPDPTTCDDAYHDALERELWGYCAWEGRSIPDEIPASPVDATKTEVPDRVIPIELDATTTRIAGASGGARSLAERLSLALGRAPAEGPRWTLSVTADTPLDRVQEVLAGLAAAGATHGLIVFSSTPTGPVPKPRDPEHYAKLAAELSPLDPSERAMQLAQRVRAALPADCPAFEKAFQSVATSAPDARCTLLGKNLADAAIACKCPEGLDPLLTLMYVVTVGTDGLDHAAVYADVTIDPKAKAAASLAGTWGEAAKSLDVATLGALWLGK